MVFHYRYWPDGGIIGLEALDALVDYVSTYPKVGIHCVAGVGRTGTLTTAAFIKHLIQKGRIQESDFTLNWLHDLVLQLRRQRSCKWVSTILQYELLYRYGLWQFRKQSATPDS
jgi:protein tyrosine phosphatase